MSLLSKHGVFERHSLVLLLGIIIVVSIGGLIEIAPLFKIESTIEKVQGIRPYTPLELVGRNVYVREGCYTCHSQMIRSLRDEVERYGHYSLAAESMYDHPFQWGSKRTGPDLARVGGKYSDAWHVEHLTNPRSVVPESIMPPYAFLKGKLVNPTYIQDDINANKIVGVPYTKEDIASAKDDLMAQADPNADSSGLQTRYGGKVNARDFDGDPSKVTEMDALVAYLQVLGTMVDFSTYEPKKAGGIR
jgi:cytochrome c oxidase cbb3-type subunit 2